MPGVAEEEMCRLDIGVRIAGCCLLYKVWFAKGCGLLLLFVKECY